MSDWNWYIMMALGAFFVLFGVVLIAGGRKEKSIYYNAVIRKPDLREYFEHSPERPELTALQIGGVIFIAAGVVLLGIGVALKFLV